MIDWGMDESEQPKKKMLVLSAVIGQTALMKKLAIEWKKDLKKNGVDFFHAVGHWNPHYKPYHGLSMRKRDAMLSRLVSHMHKYCGACLSVHVDLNDFAANATTRFKDTFGSAYAFGMQLLLIMTLQDLLHMHRVHETVNILIEDGHKNSQQAIDIISRGKDKPGATLRVGTYGLGSKLNNPILQAADLVAYGTSQYLSSGRSRLLAKLSNNAPLRFGLLPWDKSCIEAIRKDIDAREIRRKEGLKLKKFKDLAIW